MTNMKQVAERLRVVHAPPDDGQSQTWAIEKIYGLDHKGKMQWFACAIDEKEALIDWLAERDTTLLTVEVLRSFGSVVFVDGLGDISATITNHSGSIRVLGLRNGWRTADYKNYISTIGELRTLARLAGVELKQHESTPTNR